MKHFLICLFLLFSAKCFAKVEQGDTGLPTNFPSGFTENGITINYDLPITIVLPALSSIDLLSGESKLTIYGNIVIFSATGDWGPNGSVPLESQDGLIPEAYRPSVDVTNVFNSIFDSGDNHFSITITTTGKIIVDNEPGNSWQTINRPTIAWVL